MTGQDDIYFMKIPEDNGDPSSGHDVIEIDPNLTATQANIPNFTSLGGRWPNESTMPYIDGMRSGNSPSFGSAILRSFGNEGSAGDAALSPDAAQSSDRPTPNSTTSSSERLNNSSSNSGNLTAPGSCQSGRNSFEASPASSTNATNPRAKEDQTQSTAVRNIDALFQDFSASDFPSTGLTPNQQFTMPETPGKTAGGDATAGEHSGEFSWEQLNGMTPMSEGVLRTMLQMGAMETLDMGWDNPP